jgi:hypothetical protein
LLNDVLFTASTPLEKSGKLPDKQALDTLPLLYSSHAQKQSLLHDLSHCGFHGHGSKQGLISSGHNVKPLIIKCL